jgi:two-component system phosphate regulon sensor histidine kinase PhoR
MIRLGYRQRLAATYLLVAAVSLLLISAYLSGAIQRHFVSGLDGELSTYATLAAEVIRGELDRAGDVDTLAQELGRKTGLRVTVISLDGSVIGDSESDFRSMENHGDRPEIIEAHSVGVGLTTRYSTSLGAKLRYVAMPVVGAGGEMMGYVRLAMSLADIERSAGTIRKFMANAAIIAAAAGTMLSVALSQSIGRPLNDMALAAREIAHGDFNARMPAQGNDELGQLSDAFNYMATELERNVGELSERKGRMETILSAMADGVVAVDSSRKIILVNRAACEMFDTSEEHAVGRFLLEVVRNRDLAESLEDAVHGSGNVRETRIFSPRHMHLRISAAPIADGAGPGAAGAVAVLQDVTELRKLEQVRQDFVANVSHELRTPVTSIKGFADTLLDGAMDESETRERFLRVIAREADRLAEIIADLLELSRLESKGTQILSSSVVLGDAVGVSIEAVCAKAVSAGVEIVNRLPAGLPEVAGDRGLIIQVLVNLLDNAVKYTPRGGTVVATASVEGDMVKVSVIDTGAGIAPEHLPRIFERFYRADRSRSRQMGGTGLGLSIVRHIVELHGGEVSVESSLGKGSTFSFTLPVSYGS